MSEVENPVVTLLRLIESRIRVVKDDGSLARIMCSQASYDRELLKDCDAQITISKTAEPCRQQKHTLDGRLRRRIYSLRATLVAVDRSLPGSDAGRVVRDKVLEQLLLIIAENRNLPNRTVVYYYPLYVTSTTHKAYLVAAEADPEPSNIVWSEIDNTAYSELWASDDNSCFKDANGINEYAFMLFRFKIASKQGNTGNEPRKQCLKQVLLSFEGHGTAPAGTGVVLQVWDNVLGAWSNPKVGNAGEEPLTITLTSNLADYVNEDGFLYLMAKTTTPSDGVSPATLFCDFVQAIVDVRGITFCDVHSYRDIDVVDIKPFLYKEEIQIEAWLFESVATS